MTHMNAWLCGFGMFAPRHPHSTMNFVAVAMSPFAVKLDQRPVSFLMLNVLQEHMINISVHVSSEKAADNSVYKLLCID